MFGKRKVATLVAEFLGTGLLTLLVLSVQRSTIGVPFFVALAAGLSFALAIYVFGRRDGGFFNPAITLGLWTVRRIETLQAGMLIAAQFLGAWAAYNLYIYFVGSGLQPVGGKFAWPTMWAEVLGTFILATAVIATIVKKHTPGVAAAFGGIGLTVGIIAASPAAIGLLNPAIALGTRAWVLGTYVLGPIVGALIGVNLYSYLMSDKEEVTTVTTKTVTTATKTPATRAKAPVKKKPAAKRKTTRK